MKLSFGQNDCPMEESFRSKDSLITDILFELCLFRYLAQSTYFRDTLYVKEIIFKNTKMTTNMYYIHKVCTKK